jgi:hypothetical protein
MYSGTVLRLVHGVIGRSEQRFIRKVRSRQSQAKAASRLHEAALNEQRAQGFAQHSLRLGEWIIRSLGPQDEELVACEPGDHAVLA